MGIEGEEFKPGRPPGRSGSRSIPPRGASTPARATKFHNGKPLEAEDVKYSFEQYADPKNRRSVFARGIARVEIRNPGTVDLITSEPVSALLFNLTRLQGFLPRDTRERRMPAFALQPVGTGPYRFVEWKRRTSDSCWRPTPPTGASPVNPKRLVFRAIRDASTAAELRSGGVDIVAAPPVPRLRDAGQRRHPGDAGQGWPHHHLSARRERRAPFDNRKVREAANLAVNKDAIVKNVLGNRGIVMAGPFTPAWLGFDPSVKPSPTTRRGPSSSWPRPDTLQGFDTTSSPSPRACSSRTPRWARRWPAASRQVGIRAKAACPPSAPRSRRTPRRTPSRASPRSRGAPSSNRT